MAEAEDNSWFGGPDILASTAGRPVESERYKLFGVLYHHGKSTSNGHYTVAVLCRNGDGGSGENWLHIDDETMNAVRQEDMFGDSDDGRADDRCACMLFYCRTAPART